MDDLKSDIKVIRESQIRMEGDLKYHIKRTDALEDRIDHHDKALRPLYAWAWFKANYKHILFLITLLGTIIFFLVREKLK
tara:strand:- start:59 stop:298 length:240 start_codon:yes stop_codon:yes gene_type:complete